MITIIEPNIATHTRVSTISAKTRKTLATMLPGETGVVDSCCGGDCCNGEFTSHLSGDNRLLADRLQVMGICPGRHIKIIKTGDPLVIRVLNTHLGVAADLAKDIVVLCDS